MKKNQEQAVQKKTKGFPIVAIGASAGGLEAISELLKNLTPGTGMAYVYIQHLDPTHKSLLSTILTRTTDMKVVEAKHLQKIEPDQLYIIPPNKEMHILDGVLTLKQRKPKPDVHMPIDQFFVSLAEKLNEKAIGVILSGNADDGTLGLKAIKTAGGFTFAQDKSAKFQSMPKSAIAAGVVDKVLSPKEIAHELERISHQSAKIRLLAKESTSAFSSSEDEFKTILQLLKKAKGVDFTQYKINTLKRRITHRMLLSKSATLEEYVKNLKNQPTAINNLYNDLLINVTSFFRDPDALEYLKKTILPRIIKNKSQSDPLRIWVPACSTGEEVYSLAIILTEVLGSKAVPSFIQIFATDLSGQAIGKARIGLYAANELRNLSSRRLQRYFIKMDGNYRIVKPIRDLCVFAPHNVFEDPPFSRLDLISCCNLFIYLEADLQKRVIATFHYALNDTGYLLIGKSETIGASTQFFTQVEKKYKLYEKKPGTTGKTRRDSQNTFQNIKHEKILNLTKSPRQETNGSLLEKQVDEILLSNYVPASVVIDKDFEILQFRGSTGLFLEPSPGKASLNLLKMTRPGLGFELRNAVHKAIKSRQRVKRNGLKINFKGKVHPVSVEVVPLKSGGVEENFLILFEETPTPAGKDTKASVLKYKEVKKLQEELKVTKEDMRSLLEEHEAINEELQSANEEIVSSNEELQSINEELETSKEEVESTNEELMTINAELRIRNDQLVESYEYSEAVFFTIREALLVLDAHLRIRTANRSFYKFFQVKPEDTEGMLIYEIGNRQWDIPRFRELLENIIPENSQFQDFEVSHNFPGIGQKIMLLNARKIIQKSHNRELILLAIEDITEYNEAQKIIENREVLFREMADNAPVMIWVAGPDKKRTFFNRTWLEFTGRTMEQEKGDGWKETINKIDLERFLETYNRGFESRKPFRIEYRLRRRDGEYRWVMSNGKPTFSTSGEFTGFLGTCTEIHDERLLSEELEKRVTNRTEMLQKMNLELERSNDELQQFAYVASHDLQEPLRKIISFSDRLDQFKENLPEAGKNYLDKITDAAERMTKLIDDLLNLSRISRTTQRFVETDLNFTLRSALNNLDEHISQVNAKIHYAKLPVINGIALQMEQLFHNLINNALKFTKKDLAPEITISTKKPLDDKIAELNLDTSFEYTEIVFKDNGIGFSSEFAEQIFIIFQRLNSREQYPGTGIGLALCRKIVDNHGGKIFAVSEEGKGAEFHVILPVNGRVLQIK